MMIDGIKMSLFCWFKLGHAIRAVDYEDFGRCLDLGDPIPGQANSKLSVPLQWS